MEYSGKMISSLPVELILSCCQYLPYIDIEQLALTDRRLLHIIKKYLPLDLTPRISVNTFKIQPFDKVRNIFFYKIIQASKILHKFKLTQDLVKEVYLELFIFSYLLKRTRI